MSRRLRNVLVLGCFLIAAIFTLDGCAGKSETDSSAAPASTATLNLRQSGDERPPIIISDGSVDIYVDRAPDFGPRGSLNKTIDGGVTTLEHRYRIGAPPIKSFVVFIMNGMGDASECSTIDHPFEVPYFTVVYGGSKKIAITADMNLKAKFDAGQAVGDNGTHWKYAGAENDRLTSIQFPKTKHMDETVCTFDKSKKRRGTITIYQSQAEVPTR